MVCSRLLTITEDFANFGSDINQLRKRLRATPQLELFDSFPSYAAAFRRNFGIHNEQALELFHQTVSLKSVGNLTEFVRAHMLEAADIQPRINALITHFDDLTRAHESVLKAKRQIDQLTPLAGDYTQHQEASKKSEELHSCRDGLQVYFAGIKAELSEVRLESLAQEAKRLETKEGKITKEKEALLTERDKIKQNITKNGGDRLEQIIRDIRTLEEDKGKRRLRAERYQDLLRSVELPDTLSLDSFFNNQENIVSIRSNLEEQKADLQNRQTEKSVAIKTLKDKHQDLRNEIDSLRKRRSNINSQQIKIRLRICHALGVDEQEMPFVGELIKVRQEENVWEGAIERLLHNFGLSLLVPERHYTDVASWVDMNNLKGRLVYFRVREEQPPSTLDLHDQSLIRKITIKPDSEFYGWLENEMHRRFDYACCDSLQQFRRERQAITSAGQIKSGGKRHEKDDRRRLDDRSRYVLGWTNKSKVTALTNQASKLEIQIQTIGSQIAKNVDKLNKLSDKKTTLVKLGEYTDFSDLDWKELSVRIAAMEQEQHELEKTSDILKSLNERLTLQETDIEETGRKLDAVKRKHAHNEEKQRELNNKLVACLEIVNSVTEEEKLEQSRVIRPLHEQILDGHTLSLESCDNRERQVRRWIEKQIDVEARQLKTLGERIIKAMQNFCRDFPLETQEIDVNMEAAEEYLLILKQLQEDDLPRFEKRFKELLNENTIREIANFQSNLNKEKQLIKERIDIINRSLTDIEYNNGRYILLEAQMSYDPEIKLFQQQLRACTEGALTGSEEQQYAENKFLQVKEIIDRFQGREGTTDIDKRWTNKVTDVRRWFEFAASERWFEDNSEYEHYTDSSGKSGGQKEKLAYTVLAASLAYQFGLEWGEVRSRSFRFVVIDEAFGRGSDESAKYGLELFEKLNLQLLIVTPLQKIHIIEPFVASVGFVHNEAGRISLLRNLTIEEYQAEREARLG